jgi:hypothetical protein
LTLLLYIFKTLSFYQEKQRKQQIISVILKGKKGEKAAVIMVKRGDRAANANKTEKAAKIIISEEEATQEEGKATQEAKAATQEEGEEANAATQEEEEGTQATPNDSEEKTTQEEAKSLLSVVSTTQDRTKTSRPLGRRVEGWTQGSYRKSFRDSVLKIYQRKQFRDTGEKRYFFSTPTDDTPPDDYDTGTDNGNTLFL